MQGQAWLESRVEETPDAPALALPGRKLTWRELLEEATACAQRLVESGVAPGDRVATLLGSVDFAVRVHGIWRLGATVLPLNLRLSVPEFVFQLRDARAPWLLHGGGSLAARASEIAAELPSLRTLAVSSLASGDATIRTPRLAPSHPLAILYTSGTTGKPKGAVLSVANFVASALSSQQLLGSGPGDRCLACLPLFHVGGISLLVRSVVHGSCVHVQEGFEAEAVAQAIDRDGISDVSLVATTLSRLLEARGDAKAPETLRNVLVGGGPVPEPLLQAARSLGYPVAPTYGLTEAASQVATRAPADHAAQGLRPLPNVQVRVDADGDAPGEILVRGPTVMSGYLGRPQETEHALRDGWLHTGDVGRIHPDGTLTVLDRRRDLIVSGGENIYPAEIEAVILGHPRVAEVGVGRRDDTRYGARPVAWYVGDAEADEVAAYCRDRLASFKVPVGFHRVASLPRTAAGKLKRFELSEP
jgi:O-succinylbenzoic acid--CoA ligase